MLITSCGGLFGESKSLSPPRRNQQNSSVDCNALTKVDDLLSVESLQKFSRCLNQSGQAKHLEEWAHAIPSPILSRVLLDLKKNLKNEKTLEPWAAWFLGLPPQEWNSFFEWLSEDPLTTDHILKVMDLLPSERLELFQTLQTVIHPSSLRLLRLIQNELRNDPSFSFWESLQFLNSLSTSEKGAILHHPHLYHALESLKDLRREVSCFSFRISNPLDQIAPFISQENHRSLQNLLSVLPVLTRHFCNREISTQNLFQIQEVWSVIQKPQALKILSDDRVMRVLEGLEHSRQELPLQELLDWSQKINQHQWQRLESQIRSNENFVSFLESVPTKGFSQIESILSDEALDLKALSIFLPLTADPSFQILLKQVHEWSMQGSLTRFGQRILSFLDWAKQATHHSKKITLQPLSKNPLKFFKALPAVCHEKVILKGSLVNFSAADWECIGFRNSGASFERLLKSSPGWIEWIQKGAGVVIKEKQWPNLSSELLSETTLQVYIEMSKAFPKAMITQTLFDTSALRLMESWTIPLPPARYPSQALFSNSEFDTGFGLYAALQQFHTIPQDAVLKISTLATEAIPNSEKWIQSLVPLLQEKIELNRFAQQADFPKSSSRYSAKKETLSLSTIEAFVALALTVDFKVPLLNENIGLGILTDLAYAWGDVDSRERPMGLRGQKDLLTLDQARDKIRKTLARFDRSFIRRFEHCKILGPTLCPDIESLARALHNIKAYLPVIDRDIAPLRALLYWIVQLDPRSKDIKTDKGAIRPSECQNRPNALRKEWKKECGAHPLNLLLNILRTPVVSEFVAFYQNEPVQALNLLRLFLEKIKDPEESKWIIRAIQDSKTLDRIEEWIALERAKPNRFRSLKFLPQRILQNQFKLKNFGPWWNEPGTLPYIVRTLEGSSADLDSFFRFIRQNPNWNQIATVYLDWIQNPKARQSFDFQTKIHTENWTRALQSLQKLTHPKQQDLLKTLVLFPETDPLLRRTQSLGQLNDIRRIFDSLNTHPDYSQFKMIFETLFSISRSRVN